MVQTSSSLVLELPTSAESSVPSITTNQTFSANIAHEAHQKYPKYPLIPWLTESWLNKIVAYERIATASPRLDTIVADDVAIEDYINRLPNLEGPADLMLVRNENGEHIGYRAKVLTWPLLKNEVSKTKQFAA